VGRIAVICSQPFLDKRPRGSEGELSDLFWIYLIVNSSGLSTFAAERAGFRRHDDRVLAGLDLV